MSIKQRILSVLSAFYLVWIAVRAPEQYTTFVIGGTKAVAEKDRQDQIDRMVRRAKKPSV